LIAYGQEARTAGSPPSFLPVSCLFLHSFEWQRARQACRLFILQHRSLQLLYKVVGHTVQHAWTYTYSTPASLWLRLLLSQPECCTCSSAAVCAWAHGANCCSHCCYSSLAHHLLSDCKGCASAHQQQPAAAAAAAAAAVQAACECQDDLLLAADDNKLCRFCI